jgi:hypothetical protein
MTQTTSRFVDEIANLMTDAAGAAQDVRHDPSRTSSTTPRLLTASTRLSMCFQWRRRRPRSIYAPVKSGLIAIPRADMSTSVCFRAPAEAEPKVARPGTKAAAPKFAAKKALHSQDPAMVVSME